MEPKKKWYSRTLAVILTLILIPIIVGVANLYIEYNWFQKNDTYQNNQESRLDDPIISISKKDTLHSIISDKKIKGDFNGDGKEEELIYELIDENGVLFDSVSFYLDLGVDELVERYGHGFGGSPYRGRIVSTNKNIPSIDSIPGLGLVALINEGDLDGDGADEFSFSEYWIQHSTMVYLHLMSLKNQKWEKYKTAEIREGYSIDELLSVFERDTFDHSIKVREFDNEYKTTFRFD